VNVAATIADDLIDTGMQAGYDFGSVSGSGNGAECNVYTPLYQER